MTKFIMSLTPYNMYLLITNINLIQLVVWILALHFMTVFNLMNLADELILILNKPRRRVWDILRITLSIGVIWVCYSLWNILIETPIT